MKIYFPIFFILLFLIVNWIPAQSTSGIISDLSSKKYTSKIDTLYIGKYARKWTIRPFFSLKTNDLNLEKNKVQINYRPNMPLQIGLFLGYKRVGLGGSIAIPGTSPSNEIFGKTDYFDMDITLFSRRFIGEVGYANYHGFRLHNYQELKVEPRQIENSKEVGFPLRRDLRTQSARLNIFYVFNHRKYSIKAAFQQLEEQKESAGSFLLMGSINYHGIKSDTSLIPFSLSRKFNEIDPFKGGAFISLALSPGYGHTFKLKHWQFTGILFLGPALQTGKVRTIDEKPIKMKGLGVKSQFRIALGYDAPRIFAGLTYYYDSVIFDTPELQLKPSTQTIALYIGSRF